jgi:hypothetical protein
MSSSQKLWPNSTISLYIKKLKTNKNPLLRNRSSVIDLIDVSLLTCSSLHILSVTDVSFADSMVMSFGLFLLTSSSKAFLKSRAPKNGQTCPGRRTVIFTVAKPTFLPRPSRRDRPNNKTGNDRPTASRICSIDSFDRMMRRWRIDGEHIQHIQHCTYISFSSSLPGICPSLLSHLISSPHCH